MTKREIILPILISGCACALFGGLVGYAGAQQEAASVMPLTQLLSEANTRLASCIGGSNETQRLFGAATAQLAAARKEIDEMKAAAAKDEKGRE